MKEIKLSQGKVALVDDEDFKYLNQFKWCVNTSSNAHYATRRDNGSMVYMHRVIMKTPQNLTVDHINFNTIDNQKCNLRNCTISENHMNRRPRSSKSKYLGVTLLRINEFGKYFWRAYIKINKKWTHIGVYNDEIDAARAYDNMAHIHHGEFANLNFK